MEGVAESLVDGSFKKVKTERTPSGLPVLVGAAGWIDCHVLEISEKRDHRIPLAEVVDVASGPGKLMPLDALNWHYGGRAAPLARRGSAPAISLAPLRLPTTSSSSRRSSSASPKQPTHFPP